jgi:hypothetical protein
MPVVGPWPERVVLVPDEPHAHALRVELVARAPSALIGTRCLTAAVAARWVLDAAGVAYRAGEEDRRRLRLRKLFRGTLALRAYRSEQLRARGWEEAFAESIAQLEGAGMRPEDIECIDEQRAADLAGIWRALDEDAAESWTLHRIVREAAVRLEIDAGAWPSDAPVLALLPPILDAVHARLIRAVPHVTIAAPPRRPLRARGVERVGALLGDAVANTCTAAAPLSPETNERSILATHLFASPAELAVPERTRSAGPDGSVALEMYAGVDEELDAAVRWVAEEVQRGTPLRELAVVMPRAEPLATLLAARLQELVWPDEVRPVYLPAGLPATATPAGARLLAVIRALGRYLPADALVELLPRLRRDDGRAHVTPGHARLAVARMGTRGGSEVRPDGAIAWRERASRLDGDARIDGLTPALAALVAIAEQMLAGAALDDIWGALRGFALTHLIVPGDPARIVDPLDMDVRLLAADPVAAEIRGIEAIELVAERLGALRLHEGRFGEPAIYVGSIDEAAGLAFTAVRVLGLAESVFPGTLRADAVLTPGLRARLPAFMVTTDEDFALARMQALAQLVRDTRARIVFSVARCDLDGSEREPAAAFVEIAAALGRPNAITGARGAMVPTSSELERDAFAPARRAARDAQEARPVREAEWQDVVARGDAWPAAWTRDRVTDPREAIARAASMHGVLGDEALGRAVPGVTAERPLSATALRDLLVCPQRFLLKHVLSLWARPEPTETHRFSAIVYGSLVHRVLEVFLVEHGVAFGARTATLAHWQQLAEAVASTQLEAFLDEHPLFGDEAIASERRRLVRDVRTYVADDWRDGRALRFVAAERPFEGVTIATSSGPLHVAGRIDRLDVDGDVTLVRDLKTGRPRAREGRDVAPSVDVDAQLALYAVVAETLAGAWDVPDDVAAAYAYVDNRAPVRERAFVDDRAAFRATARRWLDVAAGMLREHAFVRTPRRDDCRFCPYAAVCGDRPRGEVPVASPALAAWEALPR